MLSLVGAACVDRLVGCVTALVGCLTALVGCVTSLVGFVDRPGRGCKVVGAVLRDRPWWAPVLSGDESFW